MCFYFVQLYTFLKSILCMYIYVFVYLFILLLLGPKLSSTSGMTFVSIHPYLQSWLQTLLLLRMDKIAICYIKCVTHIICDLSFWFGSVSQAQMLQTTFIKLQKHCSLQLIKVQLSIKYLIKDAVAGTVAMTTQC